VHRAVKIIGLHFCRWWYGSIFIHIFVVGSERRIFVATVCVSDIQGHPRSLILAPIDRAFASSYWSLIVTLVLSCTVSEIRRLIGWKLRIFTTPLLFYALARVNPFEFLDEQFIAKTRVLGLSVGDDFVILTCVVFTQCQRVTNRQTDNPVVYRALRSKLCAL